MKLHNKIERKFTEVKKTNRYSVLGEDNKFKKIESSNKTIKYKVYEVKLKNGMSLKCADDHILMMRNYNEVFAKDSLNKEIWVKDGFSEVVSVENLGYEEEMFDLTLNEKEEHKTYLTNDILSHNTVIVACYYCWIITFGESNQNLGIASNNLSLAEEILKVIKTITVALPIYFQNNIKIWNKRSITFENDKRILASATTSDAFRGFSLKLLYIDEVAFISNWQEFKDAVFPSLSAVSGRVLLSSTPSGLNHFFGIYSNAKEREIKTLNLKNQDEEILIEVETDDEIKLIPINDYINNNKKE